MMKKITTLLALLMLTLFIAACGSADPSGSSSTHAVGTLETAAAEPAASTENVDELIVMVNDFVTSGEITGQVENGLLAKLETIQQKLLAGDMNPATNEMGAFVNQVQAQAGKKISAVAATALIAKAQELAARMMTVIPLTSGEGTAGPVVPLPTDTALNTTKPAPLGDPLEHQVQWDLIAQQVVQSVGFSTFDYDLYQLAANSTWDATLAYYQTAAATAGWGDAPSQTDEMAGGHFAVWSVTGADGTTDYFVVAQVDAPDGTYTLNILGSK